MKATRTNACFAKLWKFFSYIRFVLTHWFFIAVSLPLLVFLFWFNYPIVVWYLQGRSPVTEYAELGTFGDMYGALNTLFSGLAFSAVVVTLLLQKRQLAVSQLELKMTRDEMTNQSSLFARQTNVMNQQLFEGTLFQLLKLYQEHIAKISCEGLVGVEALSRVCRKICDNVQPKIGSKDLNYSGYDESMYDSEISSVITPLSLVLNILKYIHDSTLIAGENKQFYVDLVKSSLSNTELCLIAIVVSHDEKLRAYSIYLEMFSLFDNLTATTEFPFNVFPMFKMTAYRHLRNEVLDDYIGALITFGAHVALISSSDNELICELELLSNDGFFKEVLEQYDYNCIIQ